jgi:hypothetical protein
MQGKKYKNQGFIGYLGYLFIFVSLIALLNGCSGEQSSQDSATESMNQSKSMDLGMAQEKGSSEQASAAESPLETTAKDESLEEYDRKIIREQFIEQQVQDLKVVLDGLERSVNQLPGAYIESLQEWKKEQKHKTEHRAHIIMRIPVDHFDSFLRKVEEQGQVTNRQLSGKDVTEEFVDNDSRLRNLKAHEERILKLYEKANTIEEMLKIEDELSRIRSSIEQLEGRQKYLRHVTSTVKLSLELFQVEEAEFVTADENTPLLTEAWIGFKTSITQILNLGKKILILLITLFPYLVIVTVLLGLVLWLRSRYYKSLRKDDQS